MNYYQRKARRAAIIAALYGTVVLTATIAALYGWLAKSPPILVVACLVGLVNLWAAARRTREVAYYQARIESEHQIRSQVREAREATIKTITHQ